MGMEKVASSNGANLSSSNFMKANQTNDHSNPQQGTGATKTNMQEKHDHGRQNKKERNQISSKSNGSSPSSHVEDKRKLFVGGLPTDITDPEFRHFFSQFGELRESVVMFDRETRRSRGFGFVTYVNPDVSQSLLQMGNHGDGIGRLVMRGKTCEIKAAAPRGQAPTRGGKANRSGRGGNRNQHQQQAHHLNHFGGNEQFPVMYQNDSYGMPYHQGVYPAVPGVPSYPPPVYHHALPHPSHAQPLSPPHGSIPLSTDRDPSDRGAVGAPYYFASHVSAPPPDRFPVPNAFQATPQIPPQYQQQGYAFVPYVPDHAQPAIPMTNMASMTQPMEPSNQASEEMGTNDEGIIEADKE